MPSDVNKSIAQTIERLSGDKNYFVQEILEQMQLTSVEFFANYDIESYSDAILYDSSPWSDEHVVTIKHKFVIKPKVSE